MSDQKDIGRLEGLMEQVLERQKTLETKIDTNFNRVAKLENQVWWARGVGWLAGFLAASGWIWKLKD